MATGHMLTNKGKLLLMQGLWDDGAAGVIKYGMVKVQGAAADRFVGHPCQWDRRGRHIR